MAFEREIIRKIESVDVKLGAMLERGEAHEARIRILEKSQSRKSDLRTTVVAGLISIVVAGVNACNSGCVKAADVRHPTADQVTGQRAKVVEITGTTYDPLFGLSDYVGTGTFVGPSLVLTAGHMCSDGDMYTAKTADGTRVIAVPIYDRDALPDDVCVMQVFGYESKTWDRLGAAPQAGQHVWYVGYPEDVLSTYDGVISEVATDQTVLDATGYTSVSMPVTHGASGSAVVDDTGRVIGVISAGNDDFPNQGWIVPWQYVKQALDAVDTK